MTKQEYLLDLKEALSSYPEDFKEEILEAFEAHFQDALDSGLSEDQAIDELGSIDEVMENIRMMNGDLDTIARTSDPRDIIKENMSALQKNIKEITKSISEVVNQNIDISFSTRVNDLKDRIKSNFNFEVRERLVIDGNFDILMKDGNTLSCDFSPHNSIFTKIIPDLQFSSDDTTTYISLNEGGGELELTIPKDVKEIVINSRSGDVEVNNLRLESIDINSNSGDYYLSNVDASTIVLKTKSGDIELRNVASLKLNASSISGDLSVRGSIQDILAVSTSGDIDVTSQNTSSLITKSVSGDIDIDVVGSYGKVEGYTVSGDIDMKVPNKDMTLYANTISGDIDIYADYRNPTKSQYIIGEGKAEVSLETKTGDITVR